MSAPLLPVLPGTTQQRFLTKGETLFHQGDRSFAIFAVRHGRMRMVRQLADGQSVVLYVARDGDTFAEASLFSPAYHCDAVADIDSEIEIYPKDVLADTLDLLPETVRSLLAHLAGQVITLRARLEIRNIRAAEERVIQYLHLVAGDGDRDADGKRAIEFSQPLKDIAAEIGLTHESFYRTLAKLEGAGIIARDGRTVTLLA